MLGKSKKRLTKKSLKNQDKTSKLHKNMTFVIDLTLLNFLNNEIKGRSKLKQDTKIYHVFQELFDLKKYKNTSKSKIVLNLN